MKVTALIIASLATTNAFTAPMPSQANVATARASFRNIDLMMAEDNQEPTNELEKSVPALTAAIWALTSTSAMAAGPDWGIFEGRTGSLLHPVMMLSMLAFSVSTAFLGFDWRRQRTIGDEISSVRKSLPSLRGSSSVAEALSVAQGAEEKDSVLISQLQAALPIEGQIKELQSERKELASKGARDKHFSQGSLLAFIGTAFAIEGPLNTYARAGKLFPGPHLYAGAGLVVLWALAAACVPAMQKGNDTARTVHIGANLAGIGLFGWQVVSGVPILLKVIEKTQWP
jgi:hypothetical protein